MTEAENVSTPAAKPVIPSAFVSREASVRIELLDGDNQPATIILSEAQARSVYSQLRKWYGRGK